MYWITPDGNYYEGDNVASGSLQVTKRPSPFHEWTNGEWLLNVQNKLFSQSEAVRIGLQDAIDIKAREFGFSGGNAFMLYAGFANPFQSVALVFAQWEASVWAEAETYRQQVIAGQAPMLTPSEAVALMPAYPS
jgi:hypothetical protein